MFLSLNQPDLIFVKQPQISTEKAKRSAIDTIEAAAGTARPYNSSSYSAINGSDDVRLVHLADSMYRTSAVDLLIN